MIINLPRYHGEASLVDDDPYATLAHHGPRDLFTPGKVYNFDGTDYVVLNSIPSAYVPAVIITKMRKYVI